MLGVMLKIDPGWHVYWKTPGDSGLPTKVMLDLPSGFTAGAVEYPVPTRQVMAGDIVNNIYENQVMLLVPIAVGKDVAVGQAVTITAHVKWLVCQEECVPGSGEGSISVSTAEDGEAANGELFRQWEAQIPAVDASGVISTPGVKISGSGAARHVDVSFNWKSDVSEIEWFAADVGEAVLKNVKLQTAGNATTISFDIEASAGASLPGKMESVLAFVDSSGVRRGVEFPLSVDWENIAAVGR
jgi:DsbC/DsbD-like thiol-disulfide interchange protein